jgi:translation initiation factor eIF-2B subunit epsilon
MAGKQKQGKKEAGGALKEDRLKAVVLADSFTKEFRPITFEKPRALLPLVNIPILEYILEMLAASGVEEIFVFCCANAALIRNYIEKSKWQSANHGVTVTTIESTSAMSAGDALRSIFAMYIIQSDFVLVQGDVISNIDLKPIIQQHKAERAKPDSQLLMTSVFKTRRSEEREQAVWLAVAPEQNQIVLFENDKRNTPLFHVALEKFEHFSDLQVRSDLIDCQIDICAPDVLEIFNENFDFRDIRRDFLKDYVLEEEVFTYKVAPHIVSGVYSSRVNSLRAYESVSRDIVNRWMYPIVPDANFTGTTHFKFSRPNNYYESKISLGRTCVIQEDTVIGKGTVIGEKSVVKSTIIGRNVKIGANVKIENSFIWDSVTIEDGAQLDNCIVCSGAKIEANAVLKRGSVISFNVIIGKDFIVEEHTRITTVREREADEENDEGVDQYIDFEEDAFDSDSDNTSQSTDKRERGIFVADTISSDSAVGTTGRGIRYQLPPNLLSNRLNFLGIQDEELEGEEDEEDEEETKMLQKIKKEVLPKEEEPGPISQDTRVFIKEAQETIKRAVLNNHSIDNTKLEINSLKFAYNTSYSDCAQAMLSGLILLTDDGKKSPTDMLKTFKSFLKSDDENKTSWYKLLKHFTRDEMDQNDLLDSLLEFCKGEGKKFGPLIQYFIQFLYETDILEETPVLDWYDAVMTNGEDSSYTAADVKLAKQCEKFIDWLKNAEEDDDDDDEEEEDEESD